jgi:hypothetical protein
VILRRLFVLGGAALLAGCALNGDFDRVRPSLVSDDMHAWVGREAAHRAGSPASEFPLTDDERRLRDLGFALIQPSYDRNRWASVLADYGLLGPPDTFDRTAYWEHLENVYRRSEASSYAQIVTDARNDVTRIEPFFATAIKVTDMDHRRAESLGFVAVGSGLGKGEKANALRRNSENAAVIGWVCNSLHERAGSYRYALERLVVATPSSRAAEAERALNMLQGRTAQYCATGPSVVAKS